MKCKRRLAILKETIGVTAVLRSVRRRNSQPDAMFPELRSFHDGLLLDVTCGPRRAVGFQIALIVKGKGPVLGHTAGELRFGAIDNYDEVSRFVRGLNRIHPDAALDQILSLEHVRDKWTLTFDHAGVLIIETSKPPTFAWTDAG